MFHRLLVAYNGSMKSRQALKAALALGLKFNSEVHVPLEEVVFMFDYSQIRDSLFWPSRIT